MKKQVTIKELEEKYQKNDLRFTQEKNDFLLPQIIDFIDQRKWINIRPEYQRRLVWDKKKKSLYLESLLLNLPTPPIFLYEWDYNRYEVMDGQQRLNSIIEFYNNDLKLTGLERWSELNGFKYSTCPPMIKSGFDRRRINAIVLLIDSSYHQNDAVKNEIRKLVFERLNTGGMTLNAQEIRNCIYAGSFGDMIIELAGNSLFDEIWGIPPYEDNIIGTHISQELANNSLFRRMADCEIVLRYFAFINKGYIKGSIKTILDECMKRNKNLDVDTINKMKNRFIEVLGIANSVFSPDTFKITEEKKPISSKSLYDAVMVSLDRLFDLKDQIIINKEKIKTSLNSKLENQEFRELIVGKASTAESIKKRLDGIEGLIKNEL